jgi:hypothetical protein
MRCAILLWIFPLALCAQDSACVVEGMVANATTGEPLRRATVNVRRTDTTAALDSRMVYTAVTDAQGKYAISDLRPGTYLLLAERSGYAPAKYNTAIQLGPGQKSSGLLILMTPHSVIAGRVVDDQGDPVIGADVQISGLSYANGRKQMTRAGGGTTNDLGEYRVFGLAAGKYYVSAQYHGNLTPDGEEYATTFYPHSADASAATPLAVPAGAQMRNIDIQLARSRSVTVRGRVSLDIQGQKVMIMLSMLPRMVMGIASVSLNSRGASVRPDGTFEISRVTPGSYNLTATATIDDKRYAARTMVQVGNTDVEGVAVTVRAGGSVTGKVHVEGRPDEQVLSVSVGLRAWESGGVIFSTTPQTKVQPDGSFQWTDVSADRYAFYATGLPEGYYVKSVRSGGTDVLANGYEAAGGSATFDVVVSPNAGSIEGTVVDGNSQKFAGATIALVPEARDRMERYANREGDQEGRFRFRNLIPGEYRLFAWEEVPSYAWMDPDYMREIEIKGQKVTVTEGGPQTVQLNLIPRK